MEMEKFIDTPETKEDIEEGQCLDTPLMIIADDEDGISNRIPNSIANSRWAKELYTPEEKISSPHMRRSRACQQAFKNEVGDHLSHMN